MSYADKELEKTTTAARVKRFREKKKALQDVTKDVTCKRCNGRGFLEERAGLIMRQCPDCSGK